MHFKILCILLLIKTLRNDRALSQRVQGIGEVQPVIVTRNESINLPNGFNPQPSPMYPMLYPFATQQPIRTITGSTSGWRPIIRKGTTKIPLLDRLATVTMESHREVDNVKLKKTITPPYPIRPLLQQEEFIIPDRNMDAGSLMSTRRNGVWRQIGGFIEGTNDNRPVETSPRQQTKSPQRVSQEKHGRRRIANFIDRKRQDTLVLQANDLEKPVKVNITNDIIAQLSIAKQINESIEMNGFPIHSSKDRLPNADTDVDISVESYNKTSSDFAYNSDEGNRSQERNMSISNKMYNFFDDSSEGTRANGETNYDDIFTPTTSFNITKVGVPFEEQNSADELSICVPLSVRERSLSNDNEIVDVERVYCFPLPTQDKNEMKSNENGTVRLDSADEFGTLNYESPTISNAAQINAALTFISIGLFLLI